MIKILIILITIGLNAETYRDETPANIEKDDLKTLKKFDNSIYNLADLPTPHNVPSISKIYDFIQANRAIINDYSKLKLYTKAQIGSRTRRALGDLENEEYSITDEVTNSREYYAIAVGGSYPLYDKKTEKTIKNERIKQDIEILERVSSYVASVAKIAILNDELEIQRLIQIRDKAMVKTGMKYLDERIETIKKIHLITKEITEEKIKRDTEKEALKIYTTQPRRLEEIL